MKQHDLKSILFNAGGVGIVLVVAGYMVHSFLKTEVAEVCSQRYATGQQFALQNNTGSSLSPIELQARVPNREWGLMDNARVVEASDKSAYYLQVAMMASEDGGNEAAPGASTNGIGFVWQPQKLESARAGCLSYRVFFHDDFSFDEPGTLPGLYAATDISQIDADELEAGFVSRLGWKKEGAPGLTIRTPAHQGLWLGPHKGRWPVNRWVSVEQEIILNSPGKANGQVRLWIDGALIEEKVSLDLGANGNLGLSGVISDVGYSQDKQHAGRLTFSPFVVQRQ